MPLTVFAVKGIPGNRRERIEAAVVAGARHMRGPHEAWIAVDPFNGGTRVLITGPNGFERIVTFARRRSGRDRGAGQGDDGITVDYQFRYQRLQFSRYMAARVPSGLKA